MTSLPANRGSACKPTKTLTFVFNSFLFISETDWAVSPRSVPECDTRWQLQLVFVFLLSRCCGCRVWWWWGGWGGWREEELWTPSSCFLLNSNWWRKFFLILFYNFAKGKNWKNIPQPEPSHTLDLCHMTQWPFKYFIFIWIFWSYNDHHIRWYQMIIIFKKKKNLRFFKGEKCFQTYLFM